MLVISMSNRAHRYPNVKIHIDTREVAIIDKRPERLASLSTLIVQSGTAAVVRSLNLQQHRLLAHEQLAETASKEYWVSRRAIRYST